jgi:hypothetical protein
MTTARLAGMAARAVTARRLAATADAAGPVDTRLSVGRELRGMEVMAAEAETAFKAELGHPGGPVGTPAQDP